MLPVPSAGKHATGAGNVQLVNVKRGKTCHRFQAPKIAPKVNRGKARVYQVTFGFTPRYTSLDKFEDTNFSFPAWPSVPLKRCLRTGLQNG